MAVLPIPQVLPPPSRDAAGTPGNSAGLPPLPSKRMPRAPLLRTPVVSSAKILRGIDHAMTVNGEVMPAPSIALPIRRSLAQPVLVHRVQLSHYFGWVGRFPGMAPGYPTAHVPTMITKRPSNRITRNPRTGQPSSPGRMMPPKRFTKALPVKQNDYVPPTY